MRFCCYCSDKAEGFLIVFRIEIHKSDSIQKVQVAPGANLLDELLAAGIEVPYSCKRGDCGQCAAMLLSGDVVAVNASAPVTQEGRVLLCNATAKSDLLLELPYYPELDSIRVLRSPAKIHSLRQMNASVMEVVLRLPPTQAFDYLPGQFIRLQNRDRVTRSYSLAGATASNQHLNLYVRRVSGGVFSSYFFDNASEGDLMYLDGPHGDFFVRDLDSAHETIFLATGTGIVPVISILAGLTEDVRVRLGDIFVYWGNRSPADEFLAERLSVMSRVGSFSYVPVFSEDSQDGMRHVQDFIASRHQDLSDTLVFACGNPKMIQSAKTLCLSRNLPGDRFRSDPFTAS